jgi:hypothetical protein
MQADGTSQSDGAGGADAFVPGYDGSLDGPNAQPDADTDAAETNGPVTEPPFVDLPPNVDLFPFFTADAEYDRTSEQIVLVAEDPPALHVYDPETRRDTAVPLPFRPWVVSVAHDGAHAVAGEYPDPGAKTAQIAFVSLPQRALVKTCTVTSPIVDIVFGPGDVAYTFPDYTTNPNVHSVRLSDCAENPSVLSALELTENSHGRLSPDGTAVYLATYSAPSQIVTVVQTTVFPKWFSEGYEIDACDLFWQTDNEDHVVSACGRVYQEGTDHKAVLQGSFEGYPARGLQLRGVVHSAITHRYAAVGFVLDSSLPLSPESLRIYRDSDLKLERDVRVPSLRTVEGGTSPAYPRLVMQRNDGSKYYVDAEYLTPQKKYVSVIASIVP